MSWQLIQSDEALAPLLQQARQGGAVILDTEFMRRNTFYPQVALLQLCFEGAPGGGDTAWLVDPLAIQDTAPIAALLEDRAVTKVLHSASEDLEVFQRWLGVLPQPLFDTQRAAALVDIGFGMGYRALVQAISGIDLPKGETRSNWLQRPLTQAQCDYAAQDVICLLPVWRELLRRCEANERLDWLLADGEDVLAAARAAGDDYHTRIKGAWKLDRRQLAALAEVCRWREQTARTRDKPRGWIIDDRACLEIARRSPRDQRALQGIDLPAPVLRRHGRDILEVLAATRELPDDALPQRLPQPLDAAQRDQLKHLKSSGRALAETLALAPEILLPGKDYELLVREHAGEAITLPPHWQGWRADAVLRPLRASLQGAAP